jgi:hypothetical protein
MSRPPAHPVLTRRAFIGTVTGGILAAPLNVHAQQMAGTPGNPHSYRCLPDTIDPRRPKGK